MLNAKHSFLLGSAQVFQQHRWGDLWRYVTGRRRKYKRGITVNIRKIAVVGSFAAGAALALAPIASADDLTTIDSDEISVLNSIFTIETDLAGDSSDVTLANAANPFDIINPADITAVQGTGTTPFDFLVYGLDPSAAGLASDPGSYNVFNGALTEFDDAFNSEAYGLLNNGALIPQADLFGSTNEISTALATGTDTGAAITFFGAGLADLSGFFDIPSLSDASTLSDLTSLLDPGGLDLGSLTDLGSLSDLGSLLGGLL